MRLKAYRLSLVLAAFVVLGLVGCGGGGGQTSKPVAINQELFTPNYISSLDRLLHWNHLPMSVSFQVPSNMTQLGWSLDTFNTAAQVWNQPGRQVLVNVLPYGNSVDVVVTFVSRASFSGSSTATGIAHVSYYENSGQITSAAIEICMDDPYRGTLSANDAQFTIAHEIGHVLGIQGHSNSSIDLMCEVFRGGQQYDLTTSDYNTIKTAYPRYFPGGNQLMKAEPTGDQGPIRTISIE